MVLDVKWKIVMFRPWTIPGFFIFLLLLDNPNKLPYIVQIYNKKCKFGWIGKCCPNKAHGEDLHFKAQRNWNQTLKRDCLGISKRIKLDIIYWRSSVKCISRF